MPSLFRESEKRNWRARWTEQGRIVNWSTGSKDRDEADRRATEEQQRRRAAGELGGRRDLTRPTGTAGNRPPGSPAPRRTLAELLGQATIPPPPPTAPATPPAPAPADENKPNPKTELLYKRAATIATLGYVGLLKRACRWAGKEPEDSDEDEEQMIAEGFEEKAHDVFGEVKLGPWAKIFLGGGLAFAGMYMGGKPLPKKPPALPPANVTELEREREKKAAAGDGAA